ncbi:MULTISPECIES: ribonuclease P protein component [Terrabacteria group]|uniref:ribonuclease P protein component n=1 Tax=Bacillati TaxID=1783272 RepID=UPI00193ABE39|nr:MULTISPECIES: ribonuclease P protein component [Terrabacteria group]MBW9212507.1 ribonuclease P protein component [Trueperella sp. zg.1013]QRG86739.1 ribonuclease P protein component [Bulleidia sp. zg-1006]
MKKVNRIKKKEEFQELIHQGKKKVNASFVLYYRKKVEDQARIGISIPKKIGHAVQRNRYKRQIRMMLEGMIPFERYPYDVVLIVRFAYPNKCFEENEKLLERTLIKDII